MNAVEILLTGIAGSTVIYSILGAECVRYWFSAEIPGEDDSVPLPPVTFFRPIKRGVPALRQKLEAMIEQMRQGDQLLLGVDEGSNEERIAETLAREHGDGNLSVVRCVPGAAANPKISKLVQMEIHARHDRWILCDSEVIAEAAFLTAFRREWTECDVLTAGYRFVGLAGWPQRLDAAATLIGLWPGLAVVRRFGKVRFTLGACTALRSGDLASVGGWGAFGDDLAEDNRIGATLAAVGRTVRLSAHIVTLEMDRLTWRDYWRHQRRAAITCRVSQPAGFAGMVVTQGVTASFLLVWLRPFEWWPCLIFALVLSARCAGAYYIGKTLSFRVPGLPAAVFAASLAESCCWALSWFSRRVWWSGAWWNVDRRGRIS